MFNVQLNIENCALNIPWEREIRFTRNAVFGVSSPTLMNNVGEPILCSSRGGTLCLHPLMTHRLGPLPQAQNEAACSL